MTSDLPQTIGELNREQWLFLHSRCLNCGNTADHTLLDSRGDTPAKRLGDMGPKIFCRRCREAGREDRNIEFRLSRIGPENGHYEYLPVEFIDGLVVSRGHD